MAKLNKEILQKHITLHKIEEIITDYCLDEGLKPIFTGEYNEIMTYIINMLKKMDIKYEERKIAEEEDINYNRIKSVIII